MNDVKMLAELMFSRLVSSNFVTIDLNALNLYPILKVNANRPSSDLQFKNRIKINL